MNRRRFLCALAGTAVAAGAGCISVQGVEESSTRRLDVADEAVTVTNPDGDVTVRTEDRDDVHLRSLKYDGAGNEDALSNVEVTTSRGEGTLAVEVVDDTDDGAVDATGVDLDLAVPENTPVPALTVDDGAVDVRGTTGPSTIDAGDGEVTVRDGGGDLTVDANDGKVDLRAVDGSVSVDAKDGDVVAREVTGDVTATLEDGSATVEDVGGTVSVDAADGDVTVTRPGAVGDCSLGDGSATIDVPAVDGDATLATDDGDLDVALARTLDAQLTARTLDGTVRVRDFDVATDDETDAVEATLGDGARSLTIRSGDGDVTVTAMDPT